VHHQAFLKIVADQVHNLFAITVTAFELIILALDEWQEWAGDFVLLAVILKICIAYRQFLK
jgi:hypothetical protein